MFEERDKRYRGGWELGIQTAKGGTLWGNYGFHLLTSYVPPRAPAEGCHGGSTVSSVQVAEEVHDSKVTDIWICFLVKVDYRITS